MIARKEKNTRNKTPNKQNQDASVYENLPEFKPNLQSVEGCYPKTAVL